MSPAQDRSDVDILDGNFYVERSVFHVCVAAGARSGRTGIRPTELWCISRYDDIVEIERQQGSLDQFGPDPGRLPAQHPGRRLAHRPRRSPPPQAAQPRLAPVHPTRRLCVAGRRARQGRRAHRSGRGKRGRRHRARSRGAVAGDDDRQAARLSRRCLAQTARLVRANDRARRRPALLQRRRHECGHRVRHDVGRALRREEGLPCRRRHVRVDTRADQRSAAHARGGRLGLSLDPRRRRRDDTNGHRPHADRSRSSGRPSGRRCRPPATSPSRPKSSSGS